MAALAPGCATAGPCEINSDCPAAQSCRAGKCVRLCVVADRDCAAGEICDVNGLCASKDGGVAGDAGVDASVDSGTDSSVQDSSNDTAVGSDTGPDSAASKHELDLCGNDGECASGLLCRPLYKGASTRCTRTCSSSAQCMTGTKCLTIGTETFCALSDVGRTCNVNSPGTCNFACATPGYCTLPCASGSDCPNGYGCATLSSQKVCVRAEQYCGGGQTCTSLLCDSSILASGCTLSCASAADCPQRAIPLTPWTCPSGNCKRPADVVGPLPQGDPAEYACSGSTKVNLCSDAQHIDFDAFTIPGMPAFNCPVGSSVAGVAGDSCVDTCRFAGSCAFGYACTGVGNITTRVGLCLPAWGAGEVGTSCTKDRDCAFGYCSAGKCSRDCSADGVCPTGSTCTAVGGPFPNVEGIPFKRCQ